MPRADHEPGDNHQAVDGAVATTMDELMKPKVLSFQF
jgi:hypothetical protein